MCLQEQKKDAVSLQELTLISALVALELQTASVFLGKKKKKNISLLGIDGHLPQ